MKKIGRKSDNKYIDFFKRLIISCRDDDIFALAGQLAYNFLLSLFPFLIFLMTLVGYSSVTSEDVFYDIEKAFPKEVFIYIKTLIIEVVDTRRSSLLSISLIFTMLAASGGFAAIIKGLNKAYNFEENRGFIKVKIISILYTLGLAIMVLASVILLLFGHVLWLMLIRYAGVSSDGQLLWDVVRYAFAFLAMIFGFAILYRYTPAKRLSWKSVMPGSIFTAFSWNVVSIFFSLYINNFNSYSRVYGSIGAIIMLMTWLLLVSVLIMLGGEINAVIDSS